MNVLKYQDYNKTIELAEDFIQFFGKSILNESKEDPYKNILKKVVDDLKLNTSLILTFGTGVGCMYPIVSNLIKNMKLNIEMTPENIVLMTVTSLTITFLEEKKRYKNNIYKKDIKSLLEECKLRGVGNGIIKKIVMSFKSIGKIFSLIFRNSKYVINGFFDMFGYTAMLVPVMNALLFIINKYTMNLNTVISNFYSLGIGIGTIIAKHGVNHIIGVLTHKLKDNGVDDVDSSLVQKYTHPEYIGDDPDENKGQKLIKED